MLHAVREEKAPDGLEVGACDELMSYLKALHEVTGDIIGWWGVSMLFLLWNMLLTCHRNAQCSTLSLCG
jgi:hypothetical protein